MLKVNSAATGSQQECAAVEGLLAMGPSLQLSTTTSKCCHLVNHLDLTTLRGERALVVVDFSPTTQLAAVTLTFDSLTLKLVHGVLVSRGSFLPSLVSVGLFVFPLGRATGRTDGQTDGQTDGRTDRQTDGHHRYIMGPPSRKDGPIIMHDQNATQNANLG